MPEIDITQLQAWANDSEQAIAHIKEIIWSIESAEESAVNWATEALENCGPPRLEDIAWISSQLVSAKSDVSYWSATLLGRLGNEALQAESSLLRLARDRTRAKHVRQRAVWALQKMSPISDQSKAELRQWEEFGETTNSKLHCEVSAIDTTQKVQD